MDTWTKYWTVNPIEEAQYINNTNNTLIIIHDSTTHTLTIPEKGYETFIAKHESKLVDEINKLLTEKECDSVKCKLGINHNGGKEPYIVFLFKNEDTASYSVSGSFIENLTGDLVIPEVVEEVSEA